MTIQSNKYKRAALTAGISLVIMMFAAFYAFGFVNSKLIIDANPVETLNNLLLSGGLFLSGILAWLIVIITDILVTLAFYSYLKDINRRQSFAGALFRGIYTAVLCAAVFQLIKVYFLISGDAAFSAELADRVSSSLDAFERIWTFGLIIFGIHLFMVGYVAFQSSFIPKILSILLIIAGVSYCLINFLQGFIPQLESVTDVIEMILTVPMTVGEIGFGIWLLIRGRKLKQLT